MVIVPPGGFAGFSQMTAASRARLSQIPRNGGGKRRRGKTTRKRRSKRKGASGKRRIKFGSPAWRKKYKLGKKRR